MTTHAVPVVLDIDTVTQERSVRLVEEFLGFCGSVRLAAAAHRITGWWLPETPPPLSPDRPAAGSTGRDSARAPERRDARGSRLLSAPVVTALGSAVWDFERRYRQNAPRYGELHIADALASVRDALFAGAHVAVLETQP